MRLSEVYRALGEVSLETGVYEQATQDIASCLEWQSMCMAADDRRIAETHYQLGNAHSLFRDYTKAIEHLRKSVSVSVLTYLLSIRTKRNLHVVITVSGHSRV